MSDTGSKYPVPEASDLSVTIAAGSVLPASRHVNQSCGRHTEAMRAAFEAAGFVVGADVAEGEWWSCTVHPAAQG